MLVSIVNEGDEHCNKPEVPDPRTLAVPDSFPPVEWDGDIFVS